MEVCMFNRFWWWVCLACSTTCFTGFVGRLIGKPGKGGGTAGTVVTLIALLLMPNIPVPAMLFLIVGSFMLGMIIIEPAEVFMLDRFGPSPRHTGEVVTCDFNETNIDEVHGMLLSALPIYFVPTSHAATAMLLLLSFTFFRIFDAYKIWPVSAVEDTWGRKGSGFNVMIDDTVAGAMAFVLTAIATFVATAP